MDHFNDQVFSDATSAGMAFETDDFGVSRQTNVAGFDFETIFKNLDGEDLDHPEEVREALGIVVGRLINSLIFDRNGAIRDAKAIGRQLLAIAYASGFTGEATMQQLGDAQGITKAAVNARVREVEQRLGLRRHIQASDGARLASAIAQTGSRHWRRRKAKAPTPTPSKETI